MTRAANHILNTGTVLNDKWLIMEFIAKGGMGEVYRAHQLNLKRDVAIKVISRELLESIDDDSEEIAITFERFSSEVRAMAQIRHANVLQIYDFGSASIQEDEEERVEYIAMEYVPGATLRSTMPEEGFGTDEKQTRKWLTKYFLPLLDGVKAIHEHGVVHRDLKPENILMDGDTPKIADFGLARSNMYAPVTRTVEVKGSPAYMSPEHFFEFGKASCPADVYSLGKILFEAVAGKITSKIMPFKRAHLSHTDTPFFQVLDQIIQKTTTEDIENRFNSVTELHKALQDALCPLKNSDTAVQVVSVPRPTFTMRRWAVGMVSIAIVSIMFMSSSMFKNPGEGSKPLPGISENLFIKTPDGSGRGSALTEQCW